MQVLGILQVHGRPTHVSNQAEKEGLHAGDIVTTAATRTKPDRGDIYINVARHPVRSAIDKLQIG